jgi:hypothetical protein
MDLHDAWEKALKNTEIIRSRVQSLMTFADTSVPYILLCESLINDGDTVVRKGEVVVERPSLILPPNIPQFSGFEFDEKNSFQENSIINFLLVRGINLPSLRYSNQTYALDIYEGGLGKAITHYHDTLKQAEDVHAGLIAGSDDCWQFSVLIYVCSQIARNAQTDVKKLLDQYKKKLE